MKEFIKELISRLEERSKEYNSGVRLHGKPEEMLTYEAIEIINEFAEEYKNDKVYQLAMMYAKNIYVYGVDVTKEWISAVQNHMALERAYVRGRQDEMDRFAEEYKDKVIIDGQYCWQTCGATEHCKECNRLCNGSIDYYENYDVLAEEYKLSEMPTGWIACKEEMPEVGKDVLCVKESGDIVIAQWGGEESSYLDEKAVWFLRRGWCRKNHIIAWMPLPPAPYTEGE